jgi:hypothetical protein
LLNRVAWAKVASVGSRFFKGDTMMNELRIIARAAQTLLAVGIVAGSVLVFQYGYCVI